MAEFVQFLITGLTTGAIYALVAVGFTLIYNASQVINFTQGEFVMIGGMATVFLHAAGIPLGLAALLAVLAAVVTGVLLHRLAIKPARAASPASLIILTIGASIFLRGVAQIVFDREYHALPPYLGTTPLRVAGAVLQPQSLLVLGGAAAIVVALTLFLNATKRGKALVATSNNALAARLVGINTAGMIGLSFAVAAAIGALGGILITPLTVTSYNVGILLALKGFAAAMLGGMGSPAGAIVGGLLLGTLESFGAGYLSSAYKDAFAFLVIILVLLAFPNGLLGRAHVQRV